MLALWRGGVGRLGDEVGVEVADTGGYAATNEGTDLTCLLSGRRRDEVSFVSSFPYRG